MTTVAQRQRRESVRLCREMLVEALQDLEAASGYAFMAGNEDLANVLDELVDTLREAMPPEPR